MARGDYINLNRRIRNHWLWQDPRKLQWWIDMLMLANYKDDKVVSESDLLIIQRGSFLTSIEKLAIRWQSSKSTVKRFLDMLEIDNMIATKRATKSLRSGTIITILNYDNYQNS